VTQTQTIGNTLLWPIVITGVYYPYISPTLKDWGWIQPHETFLGMVYTFLMIFAVISSLALAYDWSKFYKNQAYTRYRKDPFLTDIWLPFMEKQNTDPKLAKVIEDFKKKAGL
jgi:hypothetical protein